MTSYSLICVRLENDTVWFACVYKGGGYAPCCANRPRFNFEAVNFCSAAGANVLKDSSVAKEPRVFTYKKTLVNNFIIFNFEFYECDIQLFWFPNACFRVVGNLPAKICRRYRNFIARVSGCITTHSVFWMVRTLTRGKQLLENFNYG